MPIFEFACQKCSHQFEELFLTGDTKKPVCPKCGSLSVGKLMSAASFRPAGIPSGSGGFNPPACKTPSIGGG